MPSSPARRPLRVLAVLAAAVLAADVLAGCSGEGAAAPGAAEQARTPEPAVYVAVGASETVGVGTRNPARQAWPRVLHDRALPDSTLVNVGVSGATVRGALRSQVPRAVAAGPDIVTVWLAVNDLVGLVPVEVYERQLGRLVHRLGRDGRTEVLVGNVPDLWELPAYRACVPGSGVTDVPCVLPMVPSEAEVRARVAEFNAAIKRVVRAEGAELVDLSREDGLAELTSSDGFHPNARGHRAVARAFARALAR
jgi:lysophospholipase L1-like esterase